MQRFSSLTLTRLRSLILTVILLSALGPEAVGQLAITEVLSSGSTNLGPASVTQRSDFWELTNFGTEPVNLTGYKFDDGDNNLAAADSAPFQDLVIGAGESIVFVQNNVVTNAAAFREWWGTNLPQGLKIVFYSGNGLSSTGDGIRVWGPTAVSAEDVVDRVDFGEAVRGVSFTYDPGAGGFGWLSTNGVGQAFKALATDDVGSPGRTTGPTPIVVTRQPVSRVVNPGDTAVFEVEVGGRPRGEVQWLFKGVPVPGATGSRLTVTEVTAASSGEYQAVIRRGDTSVASQVAELVLASESAAPRFTVNPSGVWLVIGQEFTFKAAATGVPRPELRWCRAGSELELASGNEFTFGAAAEGESGDYMVVARNGVGSVTNRFPITVTAQPRLVITEVMSSSLTNVAVHADWWELTNLGDFAVSLEGYRFDDSSETLGSAFTFTNRVVIAAGESVVFVEGMTEEAFRQWWGEDNLSAGLKIITYRGNGLSSAGDAVNLWNAAAREDSDRVASAVFSTATAGFSFGFDAGTGEFGRLSVVGQHGAFAAVQGGDVGSPGVIREGVRTVRPRFTGIRLEGNGVHLTWTAPAGTTSRLMASGDVSGAGAVELGTFPSTGGNLSFTDEGAMRLGRRFYWVEQQP